MTNYFELNYFKKTARINYILLAIYLSISLTCHAVANRLILIDGVPLISASLAYMAVFILTNIFASINSRKFVVFIIMLEAGSNLLFIIYSNLISNMPYPSFFHNATAYELVFNPIVILYIANLIGTIISSVVDLFIFCYLYRTLKWIFFISSFVSSVITITSYTIVTDILAFKSMYPQHYWELTEINVISNIATLFLYAIIGHFLVGYIKNFLSR